MNKVQKALAIATLCMTVPLLCSASYGRLEPAEETFVAEPVAMQEIVKKPSEALKMASRHVLEAIRATHEAVFAEQQKCIDIVESGCAYSDEDVMILANMLYGEVGDFMYDKYMRPDEIDRLMQEWARIPMNHLSMGLAENLYDLMNLKLSSGYFLWHPQYSSVWFAEKAMAENPEKYDRCKENAFRALCFPDEIWVPESVIYADLAPHGSGIYKEYRLDTGYFVSTVYLSFA